MTGMNKKEGEWGVRDRNARSLATDGSGTIQPRMHEPRPGVTYPLVFDRPYYMPEADARVFLKDSSFTVTDEQDNPVANLSDTALLRRTPDQLAPDMVLANVHELTDEALLTRVAQRPNGDRFNSDTPREVLARYLIDGNTAQGNSSGAAEDLEVEDMDEDGADAMKLLQGS